MNVEKKNKTVFLVRIILCVHLAISLNAEGDMKEATSKGCSARTTGKQGCTG
jgi:hypothetical protein